MHVILFERYTILLLQEITVQCVLITDYISTHIIFNYIDVSNAPRDQKIGIGFNNGTSVRNNYSETNAAYQMSTYDGNTGKLTTTCTYLWEYDFRVKNFLSEFHCA
jgi:hypothetical protein